MIHKTAIPLTVCASLAASAAFSQTIDLDTGLWEYSITLNVTGAGVVAQETEQFCLSEASSNLTVDQLLREMSEDQCRASNAVVTVSTGSADMACVYPEDNARGDGRFEVSYTSTSYDINATMRFVGPGGATTSSFIGRGRRINDC